MPPSIRGFDSADFGVGNADSTALQVGSGARSFFQRPGGVAGIVIMGIVILTAVLAPLIVRTDPLAISGPPLLSPSPAHLMGTDGLGRDLLSGVTLGASASLFIALSVGVLALVTGLSIGLVAGYRGGFIDEALMRFTELFQVLPRFFLVAVSIALFGPGMSHMILALGLTSWPVLARVFRSEVVTMRNLDFVAATEALGASRFYMLSRVFIPHVIPSLLVLFGAMIGQVLLMEASLGFLGLGDPSVMTWGLLAGQSQSFLRVAWWLSVFPGLAIMVTVIGFNLFADSLSVDLHSR